MSQPAYFRGGGRGRGRGQKPQQAPPPGQQAQPPKGAWKPGAGRGGNVDSQQSGEKRFAAAKQRLESSVQRHLSKTNGTDDSDTSDEDEEADKQGTKIMDKLLENFSQLAGNGDVETLGNTQEFLTNFFQSGSNVCLICFESMKKTDPVWSCSCCYCMFHIPCIQAWVRDGVYQKTATSLDPDTRHVPWYCPKCRFEYSQSACPTKYLCYCGKVLEPEFDPWLVPHSCGETCDRPLRPECGHRCLLPCHPGPCPPCPKTVRVRCYCGRRGPEPRRCGRQRWGCGQACGRPLACGHHACKEPCHPGECKPCPRSGVQSCVCGKQSADRPCASPTWNCDQPCGRPLLCGHHRCERVCHAGTCGICPRSQNRYCPCGKSEYQLDCTEDAPTCGDTCGKTLDCGLHPCTQRCHYGPCGTCREMTEKRCRCGSRTKSMQCYKDYQCETKCANYKSCGKHQCKKKCCDGSCPPCEMVCGKSLPCKNHKCTSPCHTGPCYPCPLTATVSCNCGATKVVVPCGREKVTRPPRCKKNCGIPPDCHHLVRLRHRCHFGHCPPCGQVCDKPLNGCEHTCPRQCHSSVRRLVQEKVKRAGPWEAAPEIREEIADLPCPPCQVPIQVQCRGKHEISAVPCSEVGPYSCGRVCGRRLACGNHSCQIECHDVTEAPDDVTAGTNCCECEEVCGAPRPPNCTHPCPRPCHPPPCPPCKQMIRMRCHCTVTLKHVECNKWNREGGRDELKACGGACPKKLSCGHSCTMTCHTPPCPSPKSCRENINMKCPCKRRKKSAKCPDVRSGAVTLDCDENCLKIKDEKRKAAELEEEQRRASELEKQQKELDEFERKTKGRARQRKRRQTDTVETSFVQKYGRIVLVSVLVLALAVFVVQLLQS